MILPPSLDANEPASTTSDKLKSGDFPPAYEDYPANITPVAGRWFPLPPAIHPSNHIRHTVTSQSAKGKFIIDPYLRIPKALLQPLFDEETEETRANLRLSSKHSNTDGEVWIAPGSPPPSASPHTKEAVVIDARSTHSWCMLKVHDQAHTFPLSITCISKQSHATLYLPRSFTGTLIASTSHGKICVSPAVESNSTHVGQAGDQRRFFLGDLSLFEQEGWKGDQAEVSAPHSNVYVYYEDEWVEPTPGVGFMKKLFG